MDSQTLKIAGIQMFVTSDVKENEKRITNAIQKTSDSGADFLLTPESAVSGNYPGFDREQVAEAVDRIAQKAKDFGVGLILGTGYKEIENENEYCYNQVRVYAPGGEYLGYYAKILRCSPLARPGTGSMAKYAEGSLRTFNWKGICFGILVCNDLWATPGYTTMPNPYLAWKLSQMGAQIIFHALSTGVNSDLKFRTYHEINSQLWALALETHIFGVNKATEEKCGISAYSGLIGPDGNRSLEVPDVGEHFFSCEVRL